MHKKQLSIICGMTLTLVLISVVIATNQESEILAIGLITPTDANRPTPPSITLGEHGKQVATSNIQSLDVSKVRMAGKSVKLDAARESTSGTIYQYYGTGSPVNDNTKLTDFMESGGIVVETRTLRFPEKAYIALANHEDTKGQGFIVNGIMAFGYEAHAGIVPTTLDLYTDDGKVVSIWTYATLSDTIKIAEKLDIQSGFIDLNDYVDPNWTDVSEFDTSDEVPIMEPES
ncbi:MAG TPA: hypothetical protein VIH04_04685 [Nitrosarchaeum sp.]